jgi:hypothetical protein
MMHQPNLGGQPSVAKLTALRSAAQTAYPIAAMGRKPVGAERTPRQKQIAVGVATAKGLPV